MASKGNGQDGVLQLNIRYEGLKQDERAPEVAVYAIGADGKPGKRLAVSKEGVLGISREWEREATAVGFGPVVNKDEELDPESLMIVRIRSSWEDWNRLGQLAIPDGLWRNWSLFFTCVSGHVRKCEWRWRPVWELPLLAIERPVFERAVAHNLEHIAINPALQPILLPFRCEGVCEGVVEVYERVCCCRPWIIWDPRLPILIDRLKDLIRPWPIPIPLPDPPPFRVPRIGPDPSPENLITRARSLALTSAPESSAESSDEHDHGSGGCACQHGGGDAQVAALSASVRDAKLAMATIDPVETPPPSERLLADYSALTTLPAREAHEYVIARPYLWTLLCTCTTRKIGETAIQPGGTFRFCFERRLWLSRFGVSCTRAYAYKVRQFINGVWRTIYDGLAANDHFSSSDSPTLTSYNPLAVGCGDQPSSPVDPGGDVPYVILQAIGTTDSHLLSSPTQIDSLSNAIPGANRESQVAALAPNSGLCNPGPLLGVAPSGSPRNQPWGATLDLYLWVHPAMEALGAKFYRFSVADVDVTGAQISDPRPIGGSVSWSRWVTLPGGAVTPVPEDLASAAHPGLYTIPYWSPAKQWLGLQYHGQWNTALESSSVRHMLILELFDAAGVRIKPHTSPGAGTALNFHFLRWTGPTTTQFVHQPTLAHVFWTDNLPCLANIDDLRQNGVPSDAQCQFLSGPGSDEFSIGFRAWHQNGIGPGPYDTFMWKYEINWQRGLNGGTGSLGPVVFNTNAPAISGHPPAGTAQSGAKSFGNMLDGQRRCAFSVTLKAYAKHTNGRGLLTGFDRESIASFALSSP